MKLQTYRLLLEPDKDVPGLKRLKFVLTDVTVEDIFLRGIHPHSMVRSGNQHDYTGMADTILAKLNEPTAYLAELKARNLGHEVSEPGYSIHGCGESYDPVTRLLGHLSEHTYFAEEMQYEQLLQMATARLRRIWDGATARNMLASVSPDFASMREVLRRKNPNIKVGSYVDMDNIDFSLLFTVDDFLTAERLLLSSGLVSRNFRRADALKAFTDEEGRLRAAPTIGNCQASCGQDRSGEPSTLTYRCTVEGRRVQWMPSMSDNPALRSKARQIARAWGKGSGRYCFTTDIQDMERMVADLRMRLSFPDLKYGEADKTESEAAAQVRQKALETFDTPFRVNAKSSNEAIRDLLRKFEQKLTGRKEDLIRRLAALIVEKYATSQPEMDEFFGTRSFIRLAHEPSVSKRLPVLQGNPLSGHLLTMYCLRHMRGNAVLEAQYENNAVGLVDLAEAILTDRVRLTGCFVPVE